MTKITVNHNAGSFTLQGDGKAKTLYAVLEINGKQVSWSYLSKKEAKAGLRLIAQRVDKLSKDVPCSFLDVYESGEVRPQKGAAFASKELAKLVTKFDYQPISIGPSKEMSPVGPKSSPLGSRPYKAVVGIARTRGTYTCYAGSGMQAFFQAYGHIFERDDISELIKRAGETRQDRPFIVGVQVFYDEKYKKASKSNPVKSEAISEFLKFFARYNTREKWDHPHEQQDASDFYDILVDKVAEPLEKALQLHSLHSLQAVCSALVIPKGQSKSVQQLVDAQILDRQNEVIDGDLKVCELPEIIYPTTWRMTVPRRVVDSTQADLRTPIEIDEVLELTLKGNKATYHLDAILVQSGDGHGGHYISYLNTDKGWVKVDDGEIVQISSISTVKEIKTSSTLLQYRKVERASS